MWLGFFALVVSAALAVLSAAPASASSTRSFAPVADAFVDASRPRANFGGTKTLVIDARPTVRSYLRFRVGGVHGAVVRATLRVSAVSGSSRGFTVRGAGNRWGERTITYRTAPAISQVSASSGPVKRGAWTSVDVTRLVQANGDVTLALTTASAQALVLASRNSAMRPELVVVSNAAPTSSSASATTDEDTARELTLAGTDLDGDALTYAVASSPSHGTLSSLAGNKLTYTPAANYHGPDSFSFRASDGVASSTATVSLTVAPVNDAPVCADVSLAVAEDTPGSVAPSCTDVDGDALSYAIAAQGEKGTGSVSDGRLRYDPRANANGADSFTYRASDGVLASAAASAKVAIAPVNDAPVCGARSSATAEDTAVSGVACADVDGDGLTYTDQTAPANGMVALRADGTFTYSPAANYHGADGFGFTASDGKGGSDAGTVSLTVTAVNDAPVAANDRRTLAEDGNVALNAKGNDSVGPSNESGTLTVTQVSDPANGTAIILTAEDDPTRVNSVRYKPRRNFFGSDSFTYTVCDNGTTNGSPDPKCATATVFATVTAVDDAPICVEGGEAEFTTSENAPFTGIACSEVDGDEVTYTVTSDAAHGSLVFLSDGTFEYSPDGDYNGSDTLGYTGCDLGTTALLCDTGSARVTTARSVSPTVETEPVPNAGDAADDTAIWVDAADPERSAIIGTDKQGGIAVYDLAGEQLEYRADGRMNNVDLREDFPLGRDSVSLVTAGNRSDDSIAIYRFDPETRTLDDVAARTIVVGFDSYGSCMYRSATSGEFYYFVTSQDGDVEQWRLFDNGAGRVEAEMVRSFAVASQAEGCVADDQLGHVYVAEENVGIWRYGADPSDGTDPVTDRLLVDSTDLTGHLAKDVEGLAIAYDVAGRDYLFASSQGNSTYTVYRRGEDGSFRFFRSVKVEAAESGIDGTQETDGIDVTSASLGPDFPGGLFVAQDGVNGAENQNYKLVPLESVLFDAP